jgi:glutathione synthase/RimK-type ligase-like ATP-grasp enzyme
VSHRLEKLALAAATRSGAAGRAWASRLDLVRSTGLRYGLHRRREQAREHQAGTSALAQLYRDAWAEAASEHGGDLIELDGGFLEIRHGGTATRVWRQLSALDEAVSLRLALDKTMVHRLLTERGVRVPDYTEFGHTDLEAALRFMADAGAPESAFVVKPANGGRGGAAVTPCVRSEVELARAVLSGARLDTRLLIERQVPGDMYRLLFLDGELVDVVLRQSPQVTGDGRSTVLELILAENERRLEAARPQALMTVDLDCVFTLATGGRELSTVPAAGERVLAKSASSENSEEENHTIHTFAPEVIEEAAEGVRATGLRLAGVDVVTPDINRPLAEAGGAIIEVNGTPGFQYHYVVADPARATRVAIPILERVLETAGATPRICK